MKKFFAKAAVVFLIAAGSITTGAMAATADEVCTPQDAWTETIEHEAVGEETITVDNPDYVPATAEVVTPVEHPAEYVHHDAEYATEYHFAKFTRERTKQWSWGGSDWSAYGAWTKYSPETHTSWETSNTPLGNPEFHSSGTRNNGSTYWERQWQAQWDGQTRQTETKAAWDEKVKDAWTENVVTPGTPAVGEPTVVVTNPDYVAAWTELVEHEAVECPVVVPPVTEPPVVVPRVVTPPVVTPVVEKPVVKVVPKTETAETLAQTGGDINPIIPIGAALLLVGGATAAIIGRKKAHQ